MNARAEICAAYQAGLSLRAVAERFGITCREVRRELFRGGVTLRRTHPHGRDSERNRMIRQDARWGMSVNRLVGKYGLSAPRIWQICDEGGVELRGCWGHYERAIKAPWGGASA